MIIQGVVFMKENQIQTKTRKGIIVGSCTAKPEVNQQKRDFPIYIKMNKRIENAARLTYDL